ncbi:Chloride channel CLIC-like protein 1 [Labeo rohita]|uniref:Chloride channel CLIC-like protein 1 n=1 Tax=Labeo rohita TaxID=84645 RepID=A0ABQ8LI24_LABRO|nr:Chloride channel CLIC-like protein 1 [Labeo rohita]
MYLRQDFSGIPRGTQRVEPLCTTGKMSRDDETDFQQPAEKLDTGTMGNIEPEVKDEEKAKKASTGDTEEQKDTKSPDRSEAETSVPSAQTDWPSQQLLGDYEGVIFWILEFAHFCSLFIIANANINQNEEDDVWSDPFDVINYDPLSVPVEIMKVPSCPLLGFWIYIIYLHIFSSLFVIANAKFHQDEDDAWIDPFDMLNYDPTTKRMRKPTESASYPNVPNKWREFSSESCEVQQCPDVSECTSKLENLQKVYLSNFFPGYLKKLQNLAWYVTSFLQGTESALIYPDDGQTSMHYDAEVKLSKQSLVEIQKLLNEENDWTTGAMDEALSQILVRFKVHDHEAWKWRFEDTFYVDADTALKVSLIVLIVAAIICTELWSVVSWFVQFWRMFAVCFFISLIWNWFHLYMVAFAEHKKNIIEVESFNGKCTGLKQLDWKDSLSDDPCKKYYEVLMVNPILLVPPTKAITVTITSFITDPLRQIGQGISEFLKALLKDLPVTLHLPVLLIIALAIIMFMYGGAQAAIHQAVRLPRLGWRQDQPLSVVGQHQAPQLREHEEAGGDAPQPLQVHQNNRKRVNQAENRGDQGFRAGDAYDPQNRQEDRSIDLPQNFSGGPRVCQRVETLHAKSSMSRDDETDFQQRTEKVIPGIKENAEPEVKVEKKEKNIFTLDKKKQKGIGSPDRSAAETNVPSVQTDVKTLGANQRNEGVSADLAIEEKVAISAASAFQFFDEQKKVTTTSIKPVFVPVFKQFLSKLLKNTLKLDLPDDGQTSMHYDAEVKLSKQSLVEIQKFLRDDWTTGAMDEALSQILVRFKVHDHEAWKWRFKDTFYVDADTALKVSLIVLIVAAIICTELWSVVSWFVQFWRMFAVCFFISLIWNWFHLYMVAFAEHKKNIIEFESFNGKCTGLKQLVSFSCAVQWSTILSKELAIFLQT